MGKQRVEAAQILRTIGIEGVLLTSPKPRDINKKTAWINHPAVKMWIGYEECLKKYYNIISREWVRRGYKHNMGFFDVDTSKIIIPHWLGEGRFHSSHRAALLYKNFDWYSQFGWTEEPRIKYIWPR